MAKKTEAAPSGEPTPEPTATAVTEPRRSGPGWLGVAGVAVGAVVLAGALFGGGVAVGAHLPSPGQHGQAQQGQAQHGQPGSDGGRPDFGGERPALPGMPGSGERQGNGG